MERKSTVPELIHRGSKKTIPKKSRQVGLYFRPMESINGTRRGKSTGRKKNKKNATVATNQLCSLFRSGMHIKTRKTKLNDVDFEVQQKNEEDVVVASISMTKFR